LRETVEPQFNGEAPIVVTHERRTETRPPGALAPARASEAEYSATRPIITTESDAPDL
jgi:hypothetical protein